MSSNATQTNQPKLSFIGGGNMASALIGGLINQGFAPQNICVADPITESRQKLETDYQIATTDDNTIAASQADILVLAVKPQILKPVCEAIAPAIQAHPPLVISIAAGITLPSLQNWLGAATPIVRCMPNTPALVKTGATGLFASKTVSNAQKQQTESILSAIGMQVWVETEAQIDAVTAVSGSGPAYFFMVMEAMQAAGESLGLDAETAKALTLQTALGAAKMAQTSDVDAAELRRRVTSPGGTTAAAIGVFEDDGLRELFSKALQAANDRSVEMAKELGE